MYRFNESQTCSNQTKNHFNSQIANERYFKRWAWFLLIGLLVYSFYLLDNPPKVVSPDKAYLALAIVWLGFLPSIQYLFDRDRPPMPFFPLVGVFYATSFGLPIFSTDAENSGPFSLIKVSDESLSLTLLGLAGMNIAFFISKSTLWKNILPIQLGQTYRINQLLTTLWLLILLNTALRYIPFLRTIPSLGQFVGTALYFTYGMFYILWARGYLPKYQAWLLMLVFLPLEIITRLSSGLLAEVMVLFLFMFNIIWYEKKRIPVILIITVLVFYLFLTPVKSEYRRQTWNSSITAAKLNSLDKALLFFNSAFEYHQKYTFNSDPSVKKDSFDTNRAVIERSAHIVTLSNVMQDTPKVVPYWNGETYLTLFTSFIPRIVWPGKPEMRVGNEFGRRYRYLDSWDYTTSYNLPWIVEMYANFGEWGVILGMILVGCLLSFLDKKFNNPSMNSLEFVLGCSAIFSLFYQESNFALMIGGVIPMVVSMYILFKYFVK